MNALFLNTILLGGSTEDKINAVHSAGFDQLELWRQDVEQFDQGARTLRNKLGEVGVGLTDYQVLLDFDGAPEHKREAKRKEALQMLDTAVEVGAHTLLVPASTDFGCNPDKIVSDLRWLCHQAAHRQLYIAYEGMSWSTVNHTLPDAWRVVQEVGEANMGLVVDAFHIFARQRTVSDLDGIPLDNIFLVQLSDLNIEVSPSNIVDIARHHRLLPGDGHFPLKELLKRLDGYEGPINLEVFNSDLQSMAPEHAAKMAMASLKETLDI